MLKISALPLALLTLAAQAADGISFFHHDWELACDNTRTCRAAGYYQDSDETRVSVLLTRPAGPNAPVSGQLMLGSYGDEDQEFFRKLPKKLLLNMRINGRNLGTVTVPQDSLTADLSASQVAALIAALAGKATITWTQGGNSWQLSDQGAAAVLLKMDEFQGRLGTPGALLRKGKGDEAAVLPPLPMPEIKVAAQVPSRPEDASIGKQTGLRKALLATLKDPDDYCPDLQEGEPQEIGISRLSANRLLASTRCWSGAYNVGYGYWLIDNKAPFRPQLVTTSASDYSPGSISAAQKGRGLGDCWSSDTWTWDGRSFIHSESTSTGMCKLMAPGGAWSLPLIVYKIVN